MVIYDGGQLGQAAGGSGFVCDIFEKSGRSDNQHDNSRFTTLVCGLGSYLTPNLSSEDMRAKRESYGII